MRYVTDTVLKRLPGFGDFSEDEREQALADSRAIYEYVDENPWVTDHALRTWGEGQGFGPDRMTRALAVLTTMGRLAQIDAPSHDAPPPEPPPPEPPPEPPAPPEPPPAPPEPPPEPPAPPEPAPLLSTQQYERADLEAKTVDELAEIASEADIPGRSSMKKNELVDAILAQAG